MGDDGKMPLDGSFGKTQPLCVGDPYHDPVLTGTHGVSKGQRQFLTTPGKKGQTANAVGYGPLEFKTLFSGGKDQYEDPHKMHVKERLKNVRGNRTPNGFVYSNPMKRSTSPGSMEGTFRGVIEHEGEGTYAARGRREKVENDVVAKRNVQTNPAKLGGFGVPGTLIGGNNEYMHSPYDAFGNAVRSERKKDKEKHGEKKPFVSTTKRVECFDSNDHCAASKIYSLEGVRLRAPDKLDTVTPKQRAEMVADEFKIFKPSSPPKAGYNGTLNSFTEHMPDPFSEKTVRRAAMPGRRLPVAEATAGMKEALRERKPFRPSSTPKTSVVKSVATMNLRV